MPAPPRGGNAWGRSSAWRFDIREHIALTVERRRHARGQRLHVSSLSDEARCIHRHALIANGCVDLPRGDRYRVSSNLKNCKHTLRHVEVSEPGRKRLLDLGITAMEQDAALAGTDVVILAIPDNRIGRVSNAIAPKLNAGTMLIALDAAAQFAGEFPERDDLVYFVAHPCHPPIFNDATSPEAKRD